MIEQKNPKLAAVNMAIEEIQKQFGKGSIMRMGDKAKEKVDV